MSSLMLGKHEVENGETKIPSHDKQVNKDLLELLRETHDGLDSVRRSDPDSSAGKRVQGEL